MPLPLILGVAAAIAGTAGVGTGIHGGVKMKKASDTVKEAQIRNERAQKKLEKTNNATLSEMDQLGKFELSVISSFDEFSKNWEKIQNKPTFAELNSFDKTLPQYDMGEIKKVSTAANVALGALGGASLGMAGGFAASGATTTLVMALGTASTGTAISTLSGAAATSATLAALGGGSIAAGGGGIALGTTILGASTLGVGLLIGGIVFSISGSKLSDKADQAWSQMLDTENKVKTICKELVTIGLNCKRFENSLRQVYAVYEEHLSFLKNLIDEKKADWDEYSSSDIIKLKNLVLLVQLLYSMCSVKIVIKNPDKNSTVENVSNQEEIIEKIEKAETTIEKI